MRPDFLLLTDADIVYDPDVVRWLASHSVARGCVLTSLMAKLRCESFAERAFVPAFVYFFQMLYPFAWVNDPGRRDVCVGHDRRLIESSPHTSLWPGLLA